MKTYIKFLIKLFNVSFFKIFIICFDDPFLKLDELEYEPRTALFSENEGYADIEMIVNNKKQVAKEFKL